MRRFCAAGLAFYLAAVLAVAAGSARAAGEGKDAERFLTGQMLIAAPRMGDPRFYKSVVYLINHDAEGAFGLIVNKTMGKGSLKKFLEGFRIEGGDAGGDLVLRYGGPVGGGQGFVLHSADYEGPHSRKVNGNFAWSPSVTVLEAISRGQGPKRSLFTLGYSGWGPGQLDGEIARGDWLTAPADETLIFEAIGDEAWEKAVARAGIKL